MNTNKIILELSNEEQLLLSEISELQKKMNDVDPKKMEGQLLDSIKDTAIESITNALGVSDILENQINNTNLTSFNALDMDKEYKAYIQFNKAPGNINKEYNPQFVPQKAFKEVLSFDTKEWNRNSVTGSFFNAKKSEMEANNPDGYTSAYTGKHLQDGDSYQYEHVISASELARNPVHKKYLDEKVIREELVNSDENIVVIESDVNQSKNNTSNEEIDNWMNGKYNKDNSKTREEGYELDREMVHKTIDKAEKKRKEVLTKYGGKSKLSFDDIKNESSKAVGNGFKSGAKAAIGKLLSITIIELIEEFKSDNNNTLSDKIKNVIKRIKKRAKEIIDTFKDFSINGFISTLLDSILNALLKTAKNLLKFIKTAIMSILRAVKVFFSSKYTWEEKKKEALKILGVTVATLIGIALEEVIQKAIVSAFPPLVNVAGYISPVLSGLIVGIGSVLILQGFQKYQNSIEFKKLNSTQTDKYKKLANVNLIQAEVSDIQATESIGVTINIFEGSLSVIESCKSSIEKSMINIKKHSESTIKTLNNSKILQSQNDDLLNELLSL